MLGFANQVIDIQTSTYDWNHLVFHARSLLPEVAISLNLSED